MADGLRTRFPQAAVLLEDAAEDILAHRHFPTEHRARLHSTNPLERLNKESKRRSAVVGVFVLAEQDDKWAVCDRRYFSGESMKLLQKTTAITTKEELLAAIA